MKNVALDILRFYLKQNGFRLTPQRKTILEVFLRIKGHKKMEELCEAVVKKDGAIGIATVYRTINLLKQCGLARENKMPNGKKFLEPSFQHEDHDHLICTLCGAIVEFHEPLIGKFQQDVAHKYRFSIYSHRLVISGLCQNCAD